MKNIPPTISCFQEIKRIINKIKVGMLCINNPRIICQKVNSEEKTSKENKEMNTTKSIERILGVQ